MTGGQQSKLTIALKVSVSIYKSHLHSLIQQLAKYSEVLAAHKVPRLGEHCQLLVLWRRWQVLHTGGDGD
jgi:hypothetical protein